MRRAIIILSVISTTILLSACQDGENEDTSTHSDDEVSTSTPSDDEDVNNNTNDSEQDDTNKADDVEIEENSSSEAEENEPTYEEVAVQGSLIIEANYHNLDPRASQPVGLSVDRVDETLTLEETIHQALIRSDYSENGSMEEADVEVEGSKLTILYDYPDHRPFIEEYKQEKYLPHIFNNVRVYGIEEVSFESKNGEDVILHAKNITEPGPYNIESEILISNGFFSSYDEDLEVTIFLSMLQEESSSFEDTIEMMKEDRDIRYLSPFHEAIEVLEAKLDEEIAVISYNVNHDEVTEQDLKVFENALQITALDFEAEELHLINETDQTKTIFPIFNAW